MAIVTCPHCGKATSNDQGICLLCDKMLFSKPPAIPKPTPRPVIKESHICENCGSLTNGKDLTPGSLGVEIMLWLFLLIPGLIYSTWRLCNRKKGCPLCGESKIISVGTPRGQKLLKEFHN